MTLLFGNTLGLNEVQLPKELQLAKYLEDHGMESLNEVQLPKELQQSA